MREFYVKRAGPSATLQDAGRPGWQRFGVAEGGALDALALAEAAALTGAPCAIELSGYGGVFEARGGAVVAALTGASMRASLDGAPVPHRTAFLMHSGACLEIGPATDGFYGYLAVAGGFDTPLAMGSQATHPRAGFGGFQGRALDSGDVIPIGDANADTSLRRLPDAPPRRTDSFRVLWGAQAHEFSDVERARFLETTFRVSTARDRMGIFLDSDAAPIRCDAALTGVSDAVSAGDLQIPGDGRPRALLADRQPTGGYPRLATIITADLGAFAQLPVGATVRFELTDESQAVAALAEFRGRIAALAGQLEPVIRDLNTVNLLEYNLISGVSAGGDDHGD